MSFTESADKFSFAVGWLVNQHMNTAFIEGYELDQDCWNKAMLDAHHLMIELTDMGQNSVISASFWSIANATFFFSPLETFEEHQDMLDEVFDAVVNFGDVALTDEDNDEDEVFEYTAEKAFLMECLEADSIKF
jgi:hypothetical protein